MSTRAYKLPISLFSAEARLCVTHESYLLSSSDETFLAYVFSAVVPVLGVVHLFIGTMIFSSLLFIGINDT